jgi:hypothetical protein
MSRRSGSARGDARKGVPYRDQKMHDRRIRNLCDRYRPGWECTAAFLPLLPLLMSAGALAEIDRYVVGLLAAKEAPLYSTKVSNISSGPSKVLAGRRREETLHEAPDFPLEHLRRLRGEMGYGPWDRFETGATSHLAERGRGEAINVLQRIDLPEIRKVADPGDTTTVRYFQDQHRSVRHDTSQVHEQAKWVLHMLQDLEHGHGVKAGLGPFAERFKVSEHGRASLMEPLSPVRRALDPDGCEAEEVGDREEFAPTATEVQDAHGIPPPEGSRDLLDPQDVPGGFHRLQEQVLRRVQSMDLIESVERLLVHPLGEVDLLPFRGEHPFLKHLSTLGAFDELPWLVETAEKVGS